MNERNRDFKGIWIPKEIWFDTRLSALEKVILAEIDSLDSTERGCFASNQELAEFCQCSEYKVSGAISKMIDLGYIYLKKFDGRTRELKVCLAKKTSLPCKKTKSALQKKQADNINDKIIIKKENVIIKKENIKEKSSDAQMQTAKDVISYLNSVLGTNYRYQSKATQGHINARLNEGFTLEDFKAVIDKKTEEWKGTEMAQYLRPETLFGTKFESYLNAPRISRKKTDGVHFKNERTYTQAELDALITNIDDLEF